MNLNKTALRFTRILLDILILIWAFIVAKDIDPSQKLIFTGEELILLLLLILSWGLRSQSTRLYDEYRSRSFAIEVVNVLKNIIIQSLAAIVIIFFMKEIELSRRFVFIYLLLITPTILFQKYLIRKYLESIRRQGRNIRNMLIIGAGIVGLRYFDLIKKTPHFGYRVIGVLDDIEVFLKQIDTLVIVNGDDSLKEKLSSKNSIKIVDLKRIKEFEEYDNYEGICW